MNTDLSRILWKSAEKQLAETIELLDEAMREIADKKRIIEDMFVTSVNVQAENRKLATALSVEKRRVEAGNKRQDELEAEIARLTAACDDMVSVFRGEIKQLREKVDLYKDRAEESMRLWTENRSMLQDRIEELFVERDEARRVARVWYNAAGVWKERYEANDVDAISDELMMYCQPRKVTIYPTGTASEVRNDEVKR